MTTCINQYFLEGCGRCSLGGTAECRVHRWVPELQLLRSIVLECGLTEACKWGVPCYTYQDKNVLMASAFKDFAALSFFKGALLSDERKILEKPGPNSQAARVIKFTRVEDINKMAKELRACIHEAVEVEKAGLKVAFKKNPEPMPEELEAALEEDPVLKSAFEALTPGRQRGYILHFSQPKQPKTRISRIEKCIPMIMVGVGLHDKYQSGKNKNHRIWLP